MSTADKRRKLMRYSMAGLELVVWFLLGFFGGWWADRKINDPAYGLTILGGILGFAVGIYRLRVQAREISKITAEAEDDDQNDDENDDQDDEPDPGSLK